MEPEQPEGFHFLPEEIRRVVWTYIHNAARMWNGVRVGEVTSAVHPWPHQIRSYVRMLGQWPCRLLIADEVGLGKTISAGLAIRQAELSGMAKRILLMVPAGVLLQWQNELYEKFNLDVPIYDGHKLTWRQTHGRPGSIERKVGRMEWQSETIVLCFPQSHLMQRDRVRELLEADPWDLVVLDEAHHARRRGAGTAQESGPNQLLRLMRDFRSRTKALLLLTATPMQVHPVELWDLLDLLGLPEGWNLSSETFIRYFELASGNPSQADMEFLATMFQATEAAFGPVDETDVAKVTPQLSSITRRKIIRALRDSSGIPLKRLDTQSRKAAQEMLRLFSPVRYLMSRHTRELLRAYHKKGLIDTPIARREIHDIAVEFTPGERALYEAVENYISTTYNSAAADQRTAIGFVMTVYSRRLASSFYALRCTLNNRLADLAPGGGETQLDEADVSQDELAGDVMDRGDAAALARQAHYAGEQESIKELLKQIAKLGTDTKARTLKDELGKAFADGFDSAIVFTQYTDTMDYLKEYLAGNLHGVPIGCYSGSGGSKRDIGGFWTPCSKEQIKLALKDKSIRLLICNEAAGEGLNLQYCGVLVNYDLPWNPMKVEQRIGRIDRIGQKYAVIRIINLAYKDSVEADVYFALGKRINLFQGIVGKLQPILSRLPKEFEQVTLERPEHREAARRRLLADVEQSIQEAEHTGFDIDEVAKEALQMPNLPSPALELADIDSALNRTDVRPPDLEWQPLDLGSYAVRVGGMQDKIRATTAADVFDDHCDSHVFLSPGGWLFEDLVKKSVGDTDRQAEQTEQVAGHYWLIEPNDGGQCELVVVTRDGQQRISSLAELLDSLSRLGEPGRLDVGQFPGTRISLLA